MESSIEKLVSYQARRLLVYFGKYFAESCFLKPEKGHGLAVPTCHINRTSSSILPLDLFLPCSSANATSQRQGAETFDER